MMQNLALYSSQEEKINAWTHGFGAVLAVIGTIAMLIISFGQGWQVLLSVFVYGASMIVLFSASTLYHLSTTAHLRLRLKRLDHTAIYYLIAGTYTPFLALFLPTAKAKILLIALWVIALIGTFFKLYFVDRFQKVSLIAYLIMGWLAVLVIDDMQTYLTDLSIQLLVLGGVLYTVGTLFYAAKKFHYTHAIWHVFVIFAAISHFFSIWVML